MITKYMRSEVQKKSSPKITVVPPTPKNIYMVRYLEPSIEG